MKSCNSAHQHPDSAPRVGAARRAVGSDRHPVWLVLLGLLLGLGACARSPEQALVGRWRESEWRYEKLGSFETGSLPSRGDPQLPALLRHEAEHWEFRPDGAVVMRGAGGAQRIAHWKLKGRGHLLVLDGGPDSEREAYEIKELRDGRLVLHYDIGLEVRGIARLTFTRVPADQPGRAAQLDHPAHAAQRERSEPRGEGDPRRLGRRGGEGACPPPERVLALSERSSR